MDSNIVSGIISGGATLLAGGVAWLVYIGQKRDQRTNAAKIILQEIRSAESALDNMRLVGLNDTHEVLPTDSWQHHSHLFAGLLDQDEFNAVSNFYHTCNRIETDLQYTRSFIREEIKMKAQIMHEKLGKLHSELNCKRITEEEFMKQKEEFLNGFVRKESTTFEPNNPIASIAKYVSSVSPILGTSAGTKMKKMAKV